jgi:hypothetical protein
LAAAASKPLPEGPGSELSSISPSESASQIGSPRINILHEQLYPLSQAQSPAAEKDFTITLPPAHAISSDYGIPRSNSDVSGSGFRPQQPALPRRITEEEEPVEAPPADSSDEEDVPLNTTIVENQRFVNGTGGSGIREKKGFFGSIRGLFTRKGSSSVGGENDSAVSAPAYSNTPRNLPQWDKGRPDKNLKRLEKRSTMSSSAQDLSLGSAAMDNGPGRGRRRQSHDINTQEKRLRRRSASLDEGLKNLENDSDIVDLGANQESDRKAKRNPTKRRLRKESANGRAPAGPAPVGGISRNNSISSATSAPPTMSAGVGQRTRHSIDEGTRGQTANYNGSLAPTRTTTKSERRASAPLNGAAGSSLMSIVENVSRDNRQGWSTPVSKTPVMDNSSPIAMVKAPASVSRKDLEVQVDTTLRSSPSTKRKSRAPSPERRSRAPSPERRAPERGSSAPPQMYLPTAPRSASESISPADLLIPKATSSMYPQPVKAPPSVLLQQQQERIPSPQSAPQQQRKEISPVPSSSKHSTSSETPSIVLHQPKPRPAAATIAPNLSPDNLHTKSPVQNTLSPPPRSPRPDKSPLKSAMKTGGSRSPSPLGLPMPALWPITHEKETTVSPPSAVPKVASPPPSPPTVVAPTPTVDGDDHDSDTDDAASIASYETGHEMFPEEKDDSDEEYFDGDGDQTILPADPARVQQEIDEGGSEVSVSSNATIQRTTPPPPTPPPTSEKPAPFHEPPAVAQIVHAPSPMPASNSDSTVKPSPVISDRAMSPNPNPNGTTPARRKSVRVSLKPTFSPTPPAIEYDTEDEAVNWGNGSSKGSQDLWEDSSDDGDEGRQEYERAKKMLGGARSR